MNTVGKAWCMKIALLLFLFGLPGISDLPADQKKRDHNPRAKVQPGSRTFSVHDIDQDGLLSREEYAGFIEQVRLRRQANGRDKRNYPPPLRFEEIDRDKDGLLSEDEMISSLNKRLRQHRRYRYQGGQ